MDEDAAYKGTLAYQGARAREAMRDFLRAVGDALGLTRLFALVARRLNKPTNIIEDSDGPLAGDAWLR